MKRFTETLKWSDPWFRSLPMDAKCLWLWLLDSCDCAGIIEMDEGLAMFQIGTSKGLKSTLEALGNRVEIVGGKIFIPKFIRYQYGDFLNPANTAHRGVIRRLELNGIPCPVRIEQSENKAPSKHLQSPFKGAQDKDKDKDKEKNREKPDKYAEQIYSAYPRKVGKVQALKAIQKVLETEDADKLLEATKAYADAVSRWPEQELAFVPHPATWFNRGSFDDDRKTWQKGKAPQNPKPPKPELAEPDNWQVRWIAHPSGLSPAIAEKTWTEHNRSTKEAIIRILEGEL